MSFREKSAWICLISMCAVFIPYFIHIFRLTARPGFDAGAIQHAIVAAIAFQTVLAIVAHIVIAVGTRHHTEDERDATIASRSYRDAYTVFAVAVCGGLLPVMIWGSAFSALYLSQFLLLAFVIAELAHYLGQIMRYRFGS
ncbi:MAG TPA: hypothetical protein VE046_17190 [Steroidobacteraceae bacterium]|nr:hypothetical protein [Steroidobacteraceae bacterium]